MATPPYQESVNSVSSSSIENWKKDLTLGSGAFGVINLWRNTVTNETIALKQSRWSSSDGGYVADNPGVVSKQMKERWKQEVEIMNRLDHPNVVKAVKVPSCLQPKGSLAIELPALGMEYCSGGDLRKVLCQSENSSGLPESSVRLILDQISSALQYLHSLRIIHRDLKPENIVIKELPGGHVCYKLIDLGYCKELDSSSLASSFVGTLQYLAPELFTCKTYTSAVDNWSFGLLAHEIITGKRPFVPCLNPAQWLPLVTKKQSDEICAYMTNPPQISSVVFSKEITPFNHISQPLKTELESWLRIMLEFDPKKRGGRLAFSNLTDVILRKTIINVFAMNSLQVYSYEVKEETKIIELKVLIESNTGFKRKDQVLLIPGDVVQGSRSILLSGETLDNEKCVKCLNLRPGLAYMYNSNSGNNTNLPSNAFPGTTTIFLFHRTSPLHYAPYSVTSIIPPSVEGVLLNPTKLVTFEEMKCCWTQFLWVAQQLIEKYNNLVNGHQSFLNYVLQSKETVRGKFLKSSLELTTLKVLTDTVKEEIKIALDVLKESFAPTAQTQKETEKLLANFLTSAEKFVVSLTMQENFSQTLKVNEESLNEKTKFLIQFTNIRIIKTFDPLNISKAENIFGQDHYDNSKVFDIYSNVIMIYDDMKNTPREERTKVTKLAGTPTAFDNTPIVKLICDLFQLIEKLVKRSYSQLSRLLELSSSFNQIGKEFRRIELKLSEEAANVKSLHRSLIQHQWQLLAASQNNSYSDFKSSTQLTNTIDKLEQMMSRLNLTFTVPCQELVSGNLSSSGGNHNDSASLQLISSPIPSPASGDWTVLP